MNITTLHTLTFDMTVEGNERQGAANAIIHQGAAGFGLIAAITSKPLPEGADTLSRHSCVTVTSSDRAELDVYAVRVREALEFIGVELL